MDVEALAVAKIGGMLARCQHLKAFIPTNDKTPFTDGHIDLYTGLRQSKADWRGRVPIQVKGRTRRSKKTSSPTHPITRTDLRAYQKDSGVLFFVVAVDPKSGRGAPYYALLSPFAIEWILDGVPDEQHEVSVPLKKLPNDPNEIEGIVALALKTRDQNMSIGFDPVLFERLQSLTVHTASTLNLDAPVTLAPGATDFALVLNTADGLSIPLGGEIRIFPQDYVPRHIDLQVRSGAITYNGATIKRTDEETFELVISEGLTLTLRTAPGRQSTNVSLTLEPTLAGRLKDVEFYTALLDTGAITFNDTHSPIAVTADAEDADLRKHLMALRDMSTLFAHLGVDTRLVDLPQVDDTQVQQLSILYRGFVRGEEITDPAAETSRILQQVGPWNLLFLITPGSAPNKWRLVDPFSPEVRQQFQWASNEEDAQTIPITAYDIVEEDHLPTVLNMRLESIVGAYETIADFPSTYDLANQRMLAMIKAADSSETRRDEFLGAAGALNDWLIAEQGPEPHHLINRWQIAARREALSVEQRSEIRALKRQILSGGATNAGQLELACAILLGDAEEIDDLTKQLPEERLLQLRGWPIWKLNQTPS